MEALNGSNELSRVVREWLVRTCTLTVWSMVRTHGQLRLHIESGESLALYISRRSRNHVGWSRREEEPEYCSIYKSVA